MATAAPGLVLLAAVLAALPAPSCETSADTAGLGPMARCGTPAAAGLSPTQRRVRDLVTRTEDIAKRLSTRSNVENATTWPSEHSDSAVLHCRRVEAYFAAMEEHLRSMERLCALNEDPGSCKADAQVLRSVGLRPELSPVTSPQGSSSEEADNGGIASCKHCAPSAPPMMLEENSPSALEQRGLREHWLVERSAVKMTDKLGEGEEGYIFKARWRRMWVVAKVLKNPHKEQNFAHELSVLSHLRHPNLVQFLGACLDCSRGPQFILTEYCAGGSLDDLLVDGEDSWDASVAKVHRWAQDLALALCCLHEQSPPIIHRDLKPSNLLLTADGRLKLADFGLAKHLQGTMGAYQMTGFTGTLRYMAPEVVRYEENYDAKVDIYSFGLVLWGMCTGKLPLHDSTREDFMRAAAQGEDLHPPLDCIAFAPLRELILRCWDKDARARPTAEDVVNELQHMEAQYGNTFEWTWTAAHNAFLPSRSPSMDMLYQSARRWWMRSSSSGTAD
jgi:tRNA A-37 threonylcarbamoyl transferase component Bud32